MREQKGLTATSFTRRASLPPEERTASYHRAGTRAGMHPEDNPYITTRSRYHMPVPNDRYVEVDEEGEEEVYQTASPYQRQAL